MNTALLWVLLAVGMAAVGVAAVNQYNEAIEEAATLETRLTGLEQAAAAAAERAARYDAELVALQGDVSNIRRQSNTAVDRIQKARTHDPDLAALDRPWPAAARVRVFVDDDPTGQSSQPPGVATARSD